MPLKPDFKKWEKHKYDHMEVKKFCSSNDIVKKEKSQATNWKMCFQVIIKDGQLLKRHVIAEEIQMIANIFKHSQIH